MLEIALISIALAPFIIAVSFKKYIINYQNIHEKQKHKQKQELEPLDFILCNSQDFSLQIQKWHA